MRYPVAAFFILGLIITPRAPAQNIRLPISNYTNKVYGRNYAATNNCTLTDNRNLAYAGNANGIIEYDGSGWRFIPVRQGTYVTSLSVNKEGRIFVGSQNEFGYLDPDGSGSFVYRSLSDSLDPFDRFFTVVWATHTAGDRVYFQSEETLFIYLDGRLRAVNPETSFHTSFLLNQKLYIRERLKGLMVLNGEELQLVPGGDEFMDLGIFALFSTDDQDGLLIVTRERGLYTWDPERIVQKLNTLHDDFLETAGITGGVHAVARYRDQLFIGTTGGLFMENMSGAINRSIDFSPYTHIRDQVWDLLAMGNALMIGTSNGLYRYDSGSLTRISDENTYVMHFLENVHLLLAGGAGGLTCWRMDGQWKKVSDFPGITEDIKSIAVNRKSPYDDTEIWIGTSYQGVLKILLNDKLDFKRIKYQGESDGLPEDWVLPMSLGDSAVFGTRIGLLQFVDEMNIREVLPDSLKEDPEYNREYFERSQLLGHPVITPVNFIAGANNNTWAVIDNTITLIRNQAPELLVQKSFKSIDLGMINKIYPEDENIIWFGAADGLARFDMNAMNGPDPVFYTTIRRVSIDGDSIVFDGAGTSNPPELSFSHNDIQLTFTSAYYDDESKNHFSWRLVGAANQWTDWTNRKVATYINLREGDYTFQVRTINIYGDISPVAEYKFSISPPWQRTPLAFVIYAERIQRAILPQTEKIASEISGYFILFKPKDIVSGDFYWLAENRQKIIIAAVDCTGHGVPGAFMSMLGISFQNRIILENNTVKAGSILNELRKNVITSLKQTGREGETRDGMDMRTSLADRGAKSSNTKPSSTCFLRTKINPWTSRKSSWTGI